MPPQRSKHSKVTRLKMSRAHSARFAEQEQPATKECSKCGLVKPREDFPRRKSIRLDGSISILRTSPCKACIKKRWEAWWAKKEAEGIAQELKRKYRSQRKRHKPNAQVPSRKTKESIPKLPYRVPVEPLARILERELEVRSLSRIAEVTGVSADSLGVYKARRRQFLNLCTADKILTGLGMPEELDFLYLEGPH